MSERIIATLDPGSSKLILCVAKVDGENVEPIFSRRFPSQGIQYGKVVNPKRASDAIREAVREAENELGIKIASIGVPLPRLDIRQLPVTKPNERTDPSSYINEDEIRFLRDRAINECESLDRQTEEVYEAVAQSYTTEDLFQASEEMVMGSTGSSIEGNFKLFIGRKNASANLERAVEEAGLSIYRSFFAPCLNAGTILSPAEMDNGVAVMEIGAGVSSVAIYTDGILRHYGAIPFGGRNVTIDIKNECDLSETLAENIKLAYGACLPEKLQSLGEKTLLITNEEDGSSRKIPVKRLSEIIDCRMREIFEALLYMTQDSGLLSKLRSGIVLTGGGAALTNSANLLREMSGMNVRTGYPHPKRLSLNDHPVLQNTDSAESVGMILESAAMRNLDVSREKDTYKDPGDGTIFGKAPETPAKEKVKVKREREHFNGTEKLEKKVESTIGTLWDTFVKTDNNK